MAAKAVYVDLTHKLEFKSNGSLAIELSRTAKHFGSTATEVNLFGVKADTVVGCKG